MSSKKGADVPKGTDGGNQQERPGDAKVAGTPLAASVQDEHFELFCLVMERGFALHTGSSNHLVVNYQLSETSRSRHLPKIHPYGGTSYRIPERWLEPSDLYLYYSPLDDADIPQLAHYDAGTGTFTPVELQSQTRTNLLHQPTPLPVAKLASLKGLHYIKDIVCIQLYEMNFERMFQADAFVADHIRGALTEKMQEFVTFSHSWSQTSRYEQAALDCLESWSESDAVAQASRNEQAALDCLRNYRPGRTRAKRRKRAPPGRSR